MDEPHTCSQEEQAPQTTQTRKRQIDSDSDDEPLVKRARLTQKNLARFNKMGKNNKGPKKASTHRDSTDDRFDSNLAANEALRLAEWLRPPRQHKSYVNQIRKAGNEATIVVRTSGKLLKEYNNDDGYNRAFNRLFTGFTKDVGFNNGLSAPQPDLVEKLEIEEYRPFLVANHVPGAALYKDSPYSLALPHLARE